MTPRLCSQAAAPLSISFQNGKPYLAVGNNPPVPLEVAAKGGLALSEVGRVLDAVWAHCSPARS